MKEDVNPFERLPSLGYKRIVPITPPGCPLSERSSLHKRLTAKKPRDDRGKAPGIRGADGLWMTPKGWQKDDFEIDAAAWFASGAGVGIKPGPVFDGDVQLEGHLVAIDADTYVVEHAKTVKAIIDARLGETVPIRVGQYPKALYLIRTDADVSTKPIAFGEIDAEGKKPNRIEVLAKGSQFVAHGIHAKTGKPYEWKRPLPPARDLPHLPGDEFRALIAEIMAALPDAQEVEGLRQSDGKPVPPELRRADEALVRKAVAAIPNTVEHFADRKPYIDMLYAIRGALPDDEPIAFEIAEEFALQWPDNDPDTVRSDWQRMTGEPRSGFPQLLTKLREVGKPEVATELLGRHMFDYAALAEAAKEAPLSSEVLPNSFEQPRAKRFDLTPFDEAAATALQTAAAPLIKGVLDQGAMTVLYGESNAGKTFVAMDMAYHIASGRLWDGRKTAKLPVLYVAAEGGQGARKRAAALAAKHGACADFYFLLHPVNLLREDADLKPLLATIAATGLTFGLVVIDTLSRAMAGGDENASTDMGAMVKHLDVLRKASSAHVMAVHHSGKDRARGARGHSLLRAATDTEIEVADRVISVTKQRDMDGTFAAGFDLEVHTLGVDGDGDPVTSCTIKLVDRRGVEAAQVGVLTPAEETVVAAVAELDAFNDGENEGVSVAELSDFLPGKLSDLSANSVRQILKRAVQKGYLTKCRRGRWKTAIVQSGQASGQSVFE